MRLDGTARLFNHARGFGFVAPDNSEEGVFVRASTLETSIQVIGRR